MLNLLQIVDQTNNHYLRESGALASQMIENTFKL